MGMILLAVLAIFLSPDLYATPLIKAIHSGDLKSLSMKLEILPDTTVPEGTRLYPFVAVNWNRKWFYITRLAKGKMKWMSGKDPKLLRQNVKAKGFVSGAFRHEVKEGKPKVKVLEVLRRVDSSKFVGAKIYAGYYGKYKGRASLMGGYAASSGSSVGSIAALGSDTTTVFQYVLSGTIAGPVSGWPTSHIAMGTQVLSQEQLYPNAQLETLNLYGTITGGSDPENVQPATSTIATLVSAAASITTSNVAVIPVLVEYTTSASTYTAPGPGTGNMGHAFETVTMGNYFSQLGVDMDSFKSNLLGSKGLDAASVIVNPDFLGTLEQQLISQETPPYEGENGDGNFTCPQKTTDPSPTGSLIPIGYIRNQSYGQRGSSPFTKISNVDATNVMSWLGVATATDYLTNKTPGVAPGTSGATAKLTCGISGPMASSANDTFLGPNYSYNPICVNDALQAAFQYWGQNKISSKVPPLFNNDLSGYINAVNWIIRNIGDSNYTGSLTIGWHSNISGAYCKSKWNCTVDKLWGHYAQSYGCVNYSTDTNSADMQHISAQASNFWSNMGIFNALNDYRADFIVFDKYAANGLNDSFASSYTSGYLFNQNDMRNYFNYAAEVAANLKVPAMIWQLPGGHVSNLASANPASPSANMSTEAQFVFGDSIPYPSNINMGSSLSGNYGPFAGEDYRDYLSLNAQGTTVWNSTYDWLKGLNIFAIQWGSGTCATGTGMYPLNCSNNSSLPWDQLDEIDDPDQPSSQIGWLQYQVNQYYKARP